MEPSETPYVPPSRAVQVEITIDGGRRESVSVFLSTVSDTHPGPETLDEALNRDRDFLPVRSIETEQTILIRRGAIRMVTITDDVAAAALAHDETVTCVDLVRLELTGGEIVEGTLATILPPNNSRLSDYFNSGEPAFVALAVEAGVSFVHRDFISIVWL